MSDYQQYLQERDKIDFLIQKGYVISDVKENLSGAFLEFVKVQEGEKQTETLQILTADARKYFSVILINQGKK